MRILVLGDLHLRSTTPERRREADFKAVCLGKLAQALDIAKREECRAIVQPGDFFDAPLPPGELLADTIRLLRDKTPPDCPILAIHGQHDLRFHAAGAAKGSGLAVLRAAGLIRLLGAEPIKVGDCQFYGASWGEQPPRLRRGRSEGLRVLAAHAMVGDKPLWPGHELTGPAAYVKRNPGYDLYVLGDYHYPWMWVTINGPPAMNAGCMVRKNASERELEHQPRVLLLETDGMSFWPQGIDHAPAAKAFDLDRPAEPDRRRFEGFIDKLREHGSIGVDFSANMESYFEVNQTPRPVQTACRAALAEEE